MTDREIIKSIERIRRINNKLWMDILRTALVFAPGGTRIILQSIVKNDRTITEYLEKLADDQT